MDDGCDSSVRVPTSSGDVIAQRIEAKDHTATKVNLERLLVFSVWGVWYGAGLGYWSYHEAYPRLFGTVGMRAALKTTFLDLLATCPFIYYPLWHLYKTATDRWLLRHEKMGENGQKGTLMGASKAQESSATDLMAAMSSASQWAHNLGKEAWASYTTNFIKDSTAMFVVWAPIHILNFRFVPLQQRFPFIAVTGLIWTTVFSYIQYAEEEK